MVAKIPENSLVELEFPKIFSAICWIVINDLNLHEIWDARDIDVSLAKAGTRVSCFR